MIKLTIEHHHLLKALSHMQSVVERRQTIPILSNVLLETQQDMVFLCATDNEIEITERIPASVEVQGTLTVPAHKLYDIVKKLPEGSQLTLNQTEENGQLSLVSGRSRFALPCLPAEGFPTMTHEETPYQFSLESSVLLGLINKTSFAVSVEETRYNLNGIFFHQKGEDALAAVATDGHRLACSKVALPEGAKGMPSVIIPRKTIGELSKLVSEFNENVAISLSENQVRFMMGEVTLISRLIDGTYPDYEKVIPVGNDKILQAGADDLSEVIERVSVVSEKSRGIKFALNKDLLKVFTTTSDEGFAEDEIEVSYQGEPLDIGFNYRYLLDILSQMKTKEVSISFKDGSSPIIMKETTGEETLFVLMPMRV